MQGYGSDLSIQAGIFIEADLVPNDFCVNNEQC